MYPRFARRLVGLILCLFVCLTTAAWAEVAVPTLTARVTDLTRTLSASQRSALEGELQAIEARSTNQIAVLMVPSTQPESIEQYSIRVAEAWKLGQKGKDNGLLLLVAKDDHKVRVEVGYGLEGVIPDAVARQVIDGLITPRFKQGDFAGGLTAGVQQLAFLIEGQAAAPEDANANTRFSERLAEWAGEVPTILVIAIVVFGTALRWLLGPLFGALTTGGLVGAGAWFVSGTIEMALLAGGLCFVFVLVGLMNWIALGLSSSSGGSRHGGGGFSGGGGGGSSFSGGGGSFGGGGASGSW